jgi:hypothetical protein
MRGISRLAEKLLASKEGLCSLKLVNQLFMFLPQFERPSYTPIPNNSKNYVVVLYTLIFTSPDGPAFEARQGQESFLFFIMSKLALMSPRLLFNGHRHCFPGIKWPARDVVYTPPFSAR